MITVPSLFLATVRQPLPPAALAGGQDMLQPLSSKRDSQPAWLPPDH